MAGRLEEGYKEAREKKIPGGGGTPRANPPVTPSDEPFKRLMEGAHRVGTAVLGVLGKINSSGNNVSPSTRHDQPHPAPSDTMSTAVEDSLSKRLLPK